MSTQSAIQAVMSDLPPSMRRVAEAILADPSAVLERTISQLARACSTSETTVVRLCRRLDLSGYTQLRLALAEEIGSERARRGEVGREHGDDLPCSALSDLVRDLTLAETLGIEETAAALDLEQLEKAITAMEGADLVLLHGIGASSGVASDMARKLHRISRQARAEVDTHDALVAAALMRPGQVALGFSHTGTTTEVGWFLHQARERGARTIALTNAATGPVVRAADVVLRTSVRESIYRSGAMASRSAQLLLVDCLFVGLAQRDRDGSVQALRTTFDALEEYRTR